MNVANEKPKVLIHTDGTFEFDRSAVKAFRLTDAHSISVFYSRPSATFVLQTMSEGTGVPLEKVHKGGIVARKAADFLKGEGVLPTTRKKYDAQYDGDLHVIVVRNVSICKTKGAK